MSYGTIPLMGQNSSDGGRPVRRTIRKIGVTVGAVIALFGLGGFVGMPLLLHHVMTGPVAAALDRPVRVAGISVNPYTLKVDVDQLQIGERGTSHPFIEISHLRLKVSWTSLVRLALVVKELRVERPVMHLVRTADQRFNVSDLFDRPVPADQSRHPFRLAGFNLQLHDGTLHIADHSGATPGALALQGLSVELKNLHTTGQTPASLVIGARLSGGGSVALKGRLDLTQSQITTEVSLDEVDLPALQDLAPTVLPARFMAGQLSAHAHVQASFAAGHFNVRAEPATVSLDQVEWHVPDQREMPMAWTRLSASIAQLDWAARQVIVQEMRADGVRVFVRRERDGEVSLASLIRAPAALMPLNPAARASPVPWHYRIASLAIDNAEARLEDDAAPRRIELVVAPLHLHLKDLSSDLSEPIGLELGGTLNRQGRFTITGTAVPAALQANLRMATQQLDLAALDPYVSDILNMTMTSAALTMNGALDLAMARDKRRVSYRGDATLSHVHLRNRATSDSVLRWHACHASDIDAEMGEGPPKVRIGALALTDFDARAILNPDGRLNISDMLASPQSAPAAPTRAPPASSGQAPATSSAPDPRTPSPIDAEIDLGGMTLQGGHVTFTDHFITPNYTADLTDIAGTVGAFGTRATAPAAVALRGQVNGSAPVAITGSVNPLAPLAFVDLKAKAHGVELTGLTPYSAKYTGYPIVKGTLTVDVHYRLDQGQLTADNHLFIDQLTFGDRVDSRDATTLPVRLAVAVLKNARGEIAVDVPVTGVLSDPQFSLSGVILDAFVNLIVRAATSPFSLIASAFDTQEDLDSVEFTAGLATLTPDSQHKLATIAKALQDRPALRLDISGRVDRQVDREGLREARLASLIRMRKIQDSGGREDPDRVRLTPEEYETYLTRVYKAATFPKPRGFLGRDKSLPPDEMKTLLLTNMEMTDQDLQHLADARAHAVRQWLSGQVDPARLFVVAPTLKADDIQEKGKTTGVDLSLK
jgi:outer membrane protein OmpA-like peptidoglycan-associated protein